VAAAAANRVSAPGGIAQASMWAVERKFEAAHRAALKMP